jgi:hypothetical protein
MPFRLYLRSVFRCSLRLWLQNLPWHALELKKIIKTYPPHYQTNTLDNHHIHIMADPQESQQIDQVFKKAFDNLPDTPSASGWDTPSPRVWNQIRQETPSQPTGWSLTSKLMLSALVGMIAVAGWWWYSRDISTTTTTPYVPPAPVVAPVTTPTPVVTDPSEAPAVPAPQGRKPVKPSVAPAPTDMPPASDTRTPKPAPNSTIRGQNETSNEKPN